jgi:hypothetical protein
MKGIITELESVLRSPLPPPSPTSISAQQFPTASAQQLLTASAHQLPAASSQQLLTSSAQQPPTASASAKEEATLSEPSVTELACVSLRKVCTSLLLSPHTDATNGKSLLYSIKY